MGRLPDHIQLLAIGLLCMADDHGYFRADPAIIRGEILPFRGDLTSIREGLAKLREVKWIETRETAEGDIGHISTWLTHQKVDHPRDSKLKSYFVPAGSREIVANLSDEISLEGKGKEGIRERKGGEPTAPPEPQVQTLEVSSAEMADIIPEGLHPNQYAHRLLEEIKYPVVANNIRAVGAAIECEMKAGRSGVAAYEFLLECTFDAIDEHCEINAFFFTDGRYRPERRNGNGRQVGAAAARTNTTRRNIVDAFTKRARAAD
jgi:hypothetical protein